ncbi:SusE domain-containing protein [Flavobacterium sp.]|jgi:hypothetical protein|uniref:SusE domain-containing protein n=1 Tax=Flavobacterium sp. TaxID=239 RepID=UPI0037BEB67B
MKNKFKIVLIALLSMGFWSCEDEQELLFSTPSAEFAMLTPDAGTAVVLTPELGTNPALTVTWEDANYGTPTAVTYTVEIAETGTDFSDLIEAATTNNTTITWSVLELNGAAVAAGLMPFEQGGLDIRVRANTGTTGSQPTYSDVRTVLITTYSTESPKLAVPGNHQGWNPPTAPRLASSGFGETDYEGFVWLDGGYKFVGPDGSGNFNWGNTDWGDDGSFSGVLAETGESDCTATAGYYRVQANTSTLTYSTTPTFWGIIGAATPGGWDNSTALTYNPTTMKWEGIVTMTAGEFKFRANNAWTINLGGDPVEMSYDGSNLSVDAGGDYLVELDLSNPREYTYTLTAQ